MQMGSQSMLLPLAGMVAFNLVQFSTYVLKVPPLFLLCKALLVTVALGGCVRVLAGERRAREAEARRAYFSLEAAERLARLLFSRLNFLLAETRAVVLWEDPVKTLYSALALYLLSLLLRVVPSVVVTFLAVWAVFLRVYMADFVHKKFQSRLEPYARALVSLAYKIYDTIPKLNDKLL